MGVRVGPGLPGRGMARGGSLPPLGQRRALHADPLFLVEAGPADGAAADGASEVGRLATVFATADEMPAQGIRLRLGEEPVAL